MLTGSSSPRATLRFSALSLLLIVVAGSLVALCADEDFYDILEIPAKDEASEKTIKAQFRTLSKKFHPDVNPGNEGARERYVKIQRAYEVLSDRRKRKMYDMRGEEGLKQLETAGQQQQHFDPFFGHMQQQGGVQRGQNAQLNLNVPLDNIYNGNTHHLTLQKQKLCKRCKGSGAASKADFQKCSKCDGKGQMVQRIQIMPGFVQQMQVACDKCGGQGKSIKKKCPVCKGNKVYRGDHPLEVDIEQGVPEGHKIVFDMEGDQSPDQIPGDVIFVVTSTPHDTFKRKGIDLETTLRITLRQALLGFTKTIRHMDGREVPVTLQGVVQHGHRVKIAGEGMPKHNVPSEKGDLFVTLQVDLPRRLTEEQRDRLEKVLGSTIDEL